MSKVIDYDAKRIRTGKTKKDRESGATARNETNKALRVEWQQTAEKSRFNRNFPVATCNGKRNRFHAVTKKNGRIAKKAA